MVDNDDNAEIEANLDNILSYLNCTIPAAEEIKVKLRKSKKKKNKEHVISTDVAICELGEKLKLIRPTLTLVHSHNPNRLSNTLFYTINDEDEIILTFYNRFTLFHSMKFRSGAMEVIMDRFGESLSNEASFVEKNSEQRVIHIEEKSDDFVDREFTPETETNEYKMINNLNVTEDQVFKIIEDNVMSMLRTSTTFTLTVGVSDDLKPLGIHIHEEFSLETLKDKLCDYLRRIYPPLPEHHQFYLSLEIFSPRILSYNSQISIDMLTKKHFSSYYAIRDNILYYNQNNGGSCIELESNDLEFHAIISFKCDFNDWNLKDSIINLSNTLPKPIINTKRSTMRLHEYDYYLKLQNMEKVRNILSNSSKYLTILFYHFSDPIITDILSFINYEFSVTTIPHMKDQFCDLNNILEHIPTLPVQFYICCRSDEEHQIITKFFQDFKLHDHLLDLRIELILIVDKGIRGMEKFHKFVLKNIIHIHQLSNFRSINNPPEWDIVRIKDQFIINSDEAVREYISGVQPIRELYHSLNIVPPIYFHENELLQKVLNTNRLQQITLYKVCRSCGASSLLVYIANQFSLKYGTSSVKFFISPPSQQSVANFIDSYFSHNECTPILFIFDELHVQLEIQQRWKHLKLCILSIEKPNASQISSNYNLITPFLPLTILKNYTHFLISMFPNSKVALMERLHAANSKQSSPTNRDFRIFLFTAMYRSESPFIFVNEQIAKLVDEFPTLESFINFFEIIAFRSYFSPNDLLSFDELLKFHCERSTSDNRLADILFNKLKSFIRNDILLFQFPGNRIKVHPYVALLIFKSKKKSVKHFDYAFSLFVYTMALFGNPQRIFQSIIDNLFNFISTLIVTNDCDLIPSLRSLDQMISKYSSNGPDSKHWKLHVHFHYYIKASKFCRKISKNASNPFKSDLLRISVEFAKEALNILNNDYMAMNNLASSYFANRNIKDAHKLLLDTYNNGDNQQQKTRIMQQAVTALKKELELHEKSNSKNNQVQKTTITRYLEIWEKKDSKEYEAVLDNQNNLVKTREQIPILYSFTYTDYIKYSIGTESSNSIH